MAKQKLMQRYVSPFFANPFDACSKNHLSPRGLHLQAIAA